MKIQQRKFIFQSEKFTSLIGAISSFCSKANAKVFIIALSVFFTPFSFAGGWTTYSATQGTVADIEVVRTQGFMISGTFGNPANCTVADKLWIAIDHPQYEQLYSMALSAFMGDKKLFAYAHSCTEIGWHGGSFNTVTGAGAMYLKK